MKTTPEIAGVAGAIADIERRRLATWRDAGMALACSSALHRLRELLDHETVGLRLRGPASGHLANVAAVSAEMRRVRSLSVVTPEGPARKPVGRAGAHKSAKSPARAPVIVVNQRRSI